MMAIIAIATISILVLAGMAASLLYFSFKAFDFDDNDLYGTNTEEDEK